ncbi:non-ribosomal peptide synthetase [Plantactinospora sp. KLBMP9567]|uniref:non-ribosomal peptide synthetase n=1 Tax=Plantactinospora sp. KLBMP9567 TaxID=3085900 RepID=UPI0029825BAB|nr:non-ribosomal peptide synthetase [Plantactinospora sp. KLBMP9567]MDW5324850.1 amino acid adenylation domain-containing protein [Plantactinospora sp. KLBMP9567]
MGPSIAADRTIVRIAREHAAGTPERPAYVFLPDGETERDRCSFAELDVRSRAIAAVLRQRRLAGERVLIAYPSGLAYVQAFLGCLYAGAVAVPCDAPGAGPGRTRLRTIRADCAPAAVLAPPSQTEPAELAGLPPIDVTAVPDEAAEDWTDPGTDLDDLAFLQYTSGSTRTPRGVMVSHRNIVENERLIAAACGHDRDSAFVGWQPLFHDMGLVANIMQPLFLGSLSVLMPPMAFLQRPVRWLRAVSRYRAHTSGGPNFAYDLCVANSTEEDRAGLDLRSWRVAFNAAEPVRAESLHRFAETFGRYGFAEEAHFPCFGLAEATLLVTGPLRDEPPRVRQVDAGRLRAGVVAPAAGPAVPLVACGRPGLRTEIRIVDPATGQPCPDGAVGEIWVAGGGVAQGYWAAPAESAATFGARLAGSGTRYLRTGDLGCLLDGELYVTGRHKDMLVVHGQNHYPQDLEQTVERAHPAVRPASVVAFAVDTDGAERVVLCCELRGYGDRADPAAIAGAVRARVLREHGIVPHTLVLLRRGGTPKTTSGKVRRQACRDAYRSGGLPVYRKIALDRLATLPALPGAEELRRLGRPAAIERLAEALLDAVVGRLGSDPPTAAPHPGRPLVELGVNSLVALELRHAVRRGYAVDPGLTWLLGAATAEDLARWIVAELADVRSGPDDLSPAGLDDPPGGLDDPPAGLDDWSPAGPVAENRSPGGVHVDGTDPATPQWLPLTLRQQAIWFEQQLAPTAAAYHLARALTITGVPAERLDRAVTRLVRRQPALRTRFALRDGEPRCAVVPAGPALLRVDATALPEERFEARLAAEAERPFELTEELPVRLTLFRRGPAEQVLLVVAHHLVADFWSMVLVVRELVDGCAEDGPEATTAPVGTGQARQLAAERALTAAARYPESRRHWLRALAEAPSGLDLPTDPPAPAGQIPAGQIPARVGFAGGTHEFRLPAELTARLRALSAAHRSTLFSTLLAGYRLMLHRFTGQPDAVLGTLLAARDAPELADTVGYLVNLVPLRSRYRAAQPFTGFLQDTARLLREAVQHGDYPYAQMVADQRAGSGAVPAPVRTLFTLHQEYGAGGDGFRAMALGVPGRLDVDGFRAEIRPVPRRWAQFDLSLSMAEIGGELVGVWEYRQDVLTGRTVATLADGLARLLAAVAARPTAPVGDAELTDPAQRRRLLALAAGPSRPDGRRDGLHDLVAAAARRWPDAVAVTDPASGRQLSYRALHRSASRLAAQLRRRGARPDEPVAILAERGAELVVGYLGVLYAGCALLPLDPTEPRVRLAAMLADSGARLLLSERRLRGRFDGLGGSVLLVEDLLDRAGGTAAPAAVHPGQAAYLLYTSGSTGVPKGVVVPHEGIVNRIRWMQEAYRLAPGDRVLHKTPVTFDVSLWEVFWPLATGGCLVLAAPGRHRDPRYLLRLVAAERVHTAHFVPTMLAPFVAEAAAEPDAAAGLRRVVCSGEVLPASLATRAVEVLGVELENLYGPTEAAVDVTAWRCVPDPGGPVPIGRPIANVACRVLDERRRPAPVRVPGELYLGGVCLARGYLNRPGLTAQRFGPAPWAEPGARFYRSGDRARVRPDGVLEFVGRTDEQVKIGGNRVEPGEIAEVLRRQPGVRDAVAIAHPGPDGHLTITGYAAPAGTLDATGLRDQLREVLPAHLVPARVVLLDRLPTTPSGKLDRRALPVPTGPDLPAVPSPPATATEIRLAALWRAQLGVPEVGIDHDFFAAGGDSIVAVRLVGAAREAGLAVSVTDLLRYRTIRALAALVDDADAAVAAEPEVPAFALCPEAAHRPGVVDAYPVSMGQRALLSQLDRNPGYEVYLTSLAVQAPLDRVGLDRAVRAAVARHAYLRSSFDLTSYPEPIQLVHADLPPALELVDLAELPEPARRSAVDRWLRAELHRPFAVTTGPLVRFTAHDLGSAFRFTVSSFGLDGWCDATLLTEILADYAGADRAGGVELSPPRTEYRHFVAAERAAARSTSHRRFWRDELAGARPSLLPRWPYPAGGVGPVDRRHVVGIDERHAARLAGLATELAVGLKHVLLGLHVAVLRALVGRDEVVTGLQANGRLERPDGDRVVGMFNNVLPLRAPSDAGTWAELARAMRHTEGRLALYRRYPLVEAHRRLGAAGLFDTLFVFTHFHLYQRLASATGLVVGDLYAPDQTYLPLTAHFNLDAWTGRLRLLLEFDPREFGPAQVAAIGDCYRRAVAAAAVDPHRPARVTPPPVPPGSAAADARIDRLDRLLERVRGLSDERAAALLAGHGGGSTSPGGGDDRT